MIAGSAIAGVLVSVAVTSAAASDEDRTTNETSSALSIDNVVSVDDLQSIGYRVDDSQDGRAEGDGQYAPSPCLTASISSLSGGPTFSGSWSGDQDVVDQVVTEADDAAAAADIATELEGLHKTGCGYDPEDVTVSDPNEIETSDGRTTWFHVSQRLPDDNLRAFRVGVVVADDRLAMVTADSGSSLNDFKDLLGTARERLAG